MMKRAVAQTFGEPFFTAEPLHGWIKDRLVFILCPGR
ncbi:hypothetical protein QFZ43_000524 [Streptomyces afghaniensis]|nr:hypothetical protein [Streptomyces afghaniensis]